MQNNPKPKQVSVSQTGKSGGCAEKDACLTPRDLADVIPISFKISNGGAQGAYGPKVYCEKSAEVIVGAKPKDRSNVLANRFMNNRISIQL